MDTTAPIAPIDTELEELQHLALSEGCHDPEEAMRSRVARIVLVRVANIVRRIVDEVEMASFLEEEILPASCMPDIYDRFISKQVITHLEHKSLLDFFKNPNYQEMTKDIVSKLKFAQGDDNEEFFDAYMKKDGKKIDPTKLIEYIVDEIENYALVLDENEGNIQQLGKVAGVGTYYTCEGNKDSEEFLTDPKKLLLVPENDVKIIRSPYKFENTQVFDDGLVFGVIHRRTDTGLSYKVGFFFDEGDIKNLIHEQEGVIDIKREENGMIITTGGYGKKGLLKEITREEENGFVVEGVKEKQGPRKIVELLPMIYDKLYFQGEKQFIFTSSQIRDKPFNQIHIYNCLEDEAHGPLSLSPVKILHGSTGDIQLRDHGYFTITKKDDVDMLRYDPVKKELLEVDGLQGVVNNEKEIEKLLQGELAYLQYAGKGGLYTLDIKVGELNKLATLELGEGVRFMNSVVVGDRITLFYSTGNGKKNKQKIFWSHNGELYGFPGFSDILKWYKYNFVISGHADHFSFQSMEPYLKKVDGPIRL